MSQCYILGNTTISQMLGIVIKTKDKTIVIDGGSVGDYCQLKDFLVLNCKSHVDAWFFTHPHHDHVGAFCECVKNIPELTINSIYHAFPSFEELFASGIRDNAEFMLWKDLERIFLCKCADRVKKVKTGDIFQIQDVNIQVLRTYNKQIKVNFVNNSSAVYRIIGQKNSLLILGDLGVEGEKDLLNKFSITQGLVQCTLYNNNKI